MAKRLRLLERIRSLIPQFETRTGLWARVVLWLAALSISAVTGYIWAANSIVEASIAAAIATDLEFVRYRGHGFAIVYDHNLNEVGQVQLNLAYFYSSRIGFALGIGIIVLLLFRRAYVKPVESGGNSEPVEASG